MMWLLLLAAWIALLCLIGVLGDAMDRHDAKRMAEDNEKRLDQLMGENDA